MKNPSDFKEKLFPRFNDPLNSSLPDESDLVEIKLRSSCDIIGLFPEIELKAVCNSNLLDFVFEKFHEPPN
jgi:hypothetical protein